MHFSPQPAKVTDRVNPRRSASRCCQIVTFYEDFSDAIRAVKKFDAIVRAFSGDLPVHATSWSFDLLGKSELNAIILEDVTHTNVLVVASRGDHALPERIASWVEICTHTAPGKRPVILALHDEEVEAEGVAAPLCSSLVQIANRVDATFMCNRDLASKESEALPMPMRERVENAASVLGMAQYPATETFRWWGINN